jgi:hypothetical protein
MKKLFVFMLLFFLCGALFFYGVAVKANQIAHEVSIENSVLKQRIDSLSQEILCKDIDLGRYEYMLEELEETNPEASKVVNEILSKTE